MPVAKNLFDEFYLDIQNDGSGIFIRPEILVDVNTKTYQNPFPGLRPFRTSEYIFFFGREEQTQKLCERLKINRFLAVIGNSGAGKSSLVRAGLIPELFKRDGNTWDIAICRPGKNPIENLAISLSMAASIRNRENQSEPVPLEKIDREKISNDQEEIQTLLRDSIYGIEDVFTNLNPSSQNQKNLLIIVDQFEELFRFEDSDDQEEKKTISEPGAFTTEEAKDHFVSLLLRASQKKANGDPNARHVYVIITMRSEFLGDCVRFNKLAETINEGQYLVPRLTNDQLRKAIKEPLAVVRASITESLVERLVNETDKLSNQGTLDQLPLLQHALMQIYNKASVDGRTLTEEHYDPNGMRMELSKHADDVFGKFNPEQQAMAKVVFQTITESISGIRGGRRPTELSTIYEICLSKVDHDARLKKPGTEYVAQVSDEEKKEIRESDLKEIKKEINSIINTFRAKKVAFIMPPGDITITRSTVIDISHESLMRHWISLTEWIQEESTACHLYKILNQRREHYYSKKENFIGASPLLEDLKKWKDSYRNSKLWTTRCLKSKDNYRPNEDNYKPQKDHYKLNLRFLEKCIKRETVLKQRRLQHLELKIRQEEQLKIEQKKAKSYLLIAGVALLLVMMTAVSWWYAHNEGDKSKFQAANSGWTPWLAPRELNNLVNKSISKWPFNKGPDGNVVHSYQLVAESRVKLATDPDVAFRLAFAADSLGNEDAIKLVNSELTLNRYGYKRKFAVKDAVFGVEYSPTDDSLNLFALDRYYAVNSGKKAPRGYLIPKERKFLRNVEPQYRYFGPDGRFLLALDKNTQKITVINRHPLDIEKPQEFFFNLSAVDKVEICPLGELIVFVEHGDPKNHIRMFKLRANTLEEVNGTKRSIKDNIIYIYFFDVNHGLVLVGERGLYIYNTRTGDWNDLAIAPERDGSPGIASCDKNDKFKAHVLNLRDTIYIVKYEDIFSIRSLREKSTSVSIYPSQAGNAILTSSGDYLVYSNQEGRISLQILKLTNGTYTPYKSISWPGFQPRYIKNNSRGQNNLFVTAGTNGAQQDKNSLWYVYEWDIDSLPEMTVDRLKARGYLKTLTLQDSIQSHLIKCDSKTIKGREILGCAHYFSDIKNGFQSPVFREWPVLLTSLTNEDSIKYEFQKRSYSFYTKWFSLNQPDVDSCELSSFNRLCDDLNRLKAILKKRDPDYQQVFEQRRASSR